MHSRKGNYNPTVIARIRTVSSVLRAADVGLTSWQSSAAGHLDRLATKKAPMQRRQKASISAIPVPKCCIEPFYLEVLRESLRVLSRTLPSAFVRKAW